jgi:DUF4097 and DUF4098 domain-containing protein YvlB
MNRSIIPLFLMCLFLSACASAPEQYTALAAKTLDTIDVQSVLVRVDHGEVHLFESADARVQISGQVLVADQLEYQVSSEAGQVLISARVGGGNSGMPLRLDVRIPQDLPVKIETEGASVFVTNFHGTLEAASTSGNITIDGVTGGMTLRSNRGNITVQNSSGVTSMVGNYGTLHAQDTRGETAASTIMGNIVFDGPVRAGDVVRLETDHGPVAVNLNRDSALGIQVHSASGDVTCMVPGIASTPRTCDGALGSGGGTLAIRTVSGAVLMKLLP